MKTAIAFTLLFLSANSMADLITPNQISLGDASNQAWEVLTTHLGIKPGTGAFHDKGQASASVKGTLYCRKGKTDKANCIFYPEKSDSDASPSKSKPDTK